MKNRFIIFLSLTFFCNTSKSQFYDFNETELKGNVHKITWVNYEVIKHKAIIRKGKVINYLIEIFDDNGSKIQREQRDSLYKIEWIYYFKYDANNRCIKENWVNSDGQIKEFTIRKFIDSKRYFERVYENDSTLALLRYVELNAENKIKEEKEYNKDSVLVERRTYLYTGSKQKKSEKIEFIERKEVLTHKYEYLDSLSFIEYVYKNEEENYNKKYEWLYSKDKTKFTWIITSKHGVFKTEFNYKYDLVGNWVSRSRADTDKLELVERKIEYK